MKEGETAHIDYTTRKPNKRVWLERCPSCGKVGKVLRVPITRGLNSGRVRVSWTHSEDVTHCGIYLRVEKQTSCWGWED